MATKTCYRCLRELDEEKFKVDKRNFDGRTIACRHCYENNQIGKGFVTPEGRQAHREKMTGKKHSVSQCLNQSKGQKRVVEEGRHHWKIYDERNVEHDRKNFNYKLWQNTIREKFDNKCAHCGETKLLHCHHIKCFYDYPELRYDISNGLLVCIRCHKKIHVQQNQKRNIA